jgi:hypothetical protein
MRRPGLALDRPRAPAARPPDSPTSSGTESEPDAELKDENGSSGEDLSGVLALHQNVPIHTGTSA